MVSHGRDVNLSNRIELAKKRDCFNRLARAIVLEIVLCCEIEIIRRSTLLVYFYYEYNTADSYTFIFES